MSAKGDGSLGELLAEVRRRRGFPLRSEEKALWTAGHMLEGRQIARLTAAEAFLAAQLVKLGILTDWSKAGLTGVPTIVVRRME